jgi:hypothetical protein
VRPGLLLAGCGTADALPFPFALELNSQIALDGAKPSLYTTCSAAIEAVPFPKL